jgi:hypothetical protein
MSSPSPNPLSNSSAIRADSVEVWNPLKRKYEAVGESIVGLAPDDLNSIELLAQAIDNGPHYFQTVAAGLSAKADLVRRSQLSGQVQALLHDAVRTFQVPRPACRTRAAVVRTWRTRPDEVYRPARETLLGREIQ